MNDFNQKVADMANQFAEAVKAAVPAAPEVKFNKNGYEIRAEVLDMAKSFSEFEFSSKYMGWEQTVERNKDTGQIVNTVNMPSVPSVDTILDTAEKFYNFINKK